MPRYAAIDIGSNSVRLAVAEVDPGTPVRTIAASREVTRLGTSVFSEGSISAEAMDNLCGVLTRYRAALERHHAMGVRAVATSAVRDAVNQEEFLRRASDSAGMPVEIISGIEESRLIHAGVQSVWPHPQERLLIIDIGGGSAEVIVSEGGRVTAAFSKPLGAVRLKQMFLANDPPAAADLDRLNGFIDEKVSAILRKTGKVEFDRVIATSSTAAAVICAVNGIDRRSREIADRKRATAAQVERLVAELSGQKLSQRRKQMGIGPRRAEIIVGGASVLSRILRAFGARSVYYSVAGVRDGIIADLAARRVGATLGRLNKEQRRIVETMARRFGVDVRHARKTAELAASLFQGLKPLHTLPAESGKLLEAAAYLVDIGHYVSDMGHHKHSHYLVANADLPAFTTEERGIIALLCRYHRKSMPSARHVGYQNLSPANQRLVLRLVPILRLADALDRSHDQRVDALAVELLPNQAVIALRSDADTNLELWAGERAGEVFRQVFGVPLSLRRGM
ncbi:MAG TPA: Ppx/GppA phosphatase family protein [Bryobacteraceae bacterium]|nr:Ppx/GppA phosphatase family protein [Bryobacteraceae bacterium]